MAGHAYRYRLRATLDVDDRRRLGPELLVELVRRLLAAVPGLRGRVHVDVDEIERLDP